MLVKQLKRGGAFHLLLRDLDWFPPAPLEEDAENGHDDC